MLLSETSTLRPAASRRKSNNTHHTAHAKMRLIHLIRALNVSEGLSPADLTRRFGVRQRTIERDINLLKEAGLRITYDRKKHHYRIVGKSFLAPVEFMPDEVMALLLLASHIGDDPILQKPALQAMAKIRSQLPADEWMEVEPLEKHVSVRPVVGEAPGSDGDVYMKIETAIRSRCELDCVYEAAHSRQGENRRRFILRPYHLLFSNRAWYVIGHCSDRRALRTLKLVRFEAIKMTDRKFRIPSDFSVAQYLGKCWRLIPGKPRANVCLHIAKEFAPGICETQWHGSQQVELQSDGSAILNFTVDGFDEIIWWILSLGPQCRVLHPPELAMKVRDLAARTAAIYAV